MLSVESQNDPHGQAASRSQSIAGPRNSDSSRVHWLIAASVLLTGSPESPQPAEAMAIDIAISALRIVALRICWLSLPWRGLRPQDMDMGPTATQGICQLVQVTNDRNDQVDHSARQRLTRLQWFRSCSDLVSIRVHNAGARSLASTAERVDIDQLTRKGDAGAPSFRIFSIGGRCCVLIVYPRFRRSEPRRGLRWRALAAPLLRAHVRRWSNHRRALAGT